MQQGYGSKEAQMFFSFLLIAGNFASDLANSYFIWLKSEAMSADDFQLLFLYDQWNIIRKHRPYSIIFLALLTTPALMPPLPTLFLESLCPRAGRPKSTPFCPDVTDS